MLDGALHTIISIFPKKIRSVQTIPIMMLTFPPPIPPPTKSNSLVESGEGLVRSQVGICDFGLNRGSLVFERCVGEDRPVLCTTTQ